MASPMGGWTSVHRGQVDVSIRLEMLQVARLAPTLLGDSADLVRAFVATQLRRDGAGCDRDGAPDLYYTIFVLSGLQALQMKFDRAAVAAHLRAAFARDDLDFVHLGALARCWGSLGVESVDT